LLVNTWKNVISHGAFLDGEIARLAENWEIERIALIDKIILRNGPV